MTDEHSEPEERHKPQGKDDTGKWADIIKAVNSPLSLFAVPALCFESATIAALFSDLTTGYKFAAFLIGQGCTLTLLGVATYITIRYARHWSPEMAKALEKSEEAEREARAALDTAERSRELLRSAGVQGLLEEIVEERIERRLKDKKENE